jgi:hypothetical protein
VAYARASENNRLEFPVLWGVGEKGRDSLHFLVV